jgi:hypothetical protein
VSKAARRPAGRLAAPPVYYGRIGRTTAIAFAMMGVMLVIGTVGYHYVDDFLWLDAFHQSAMLLAGMGPVEEITTTAGKWFDSIYALLCAIIMLGAAGIMFSPVIHRILHRFHLEDAAADE